MNIPVLRHRSMPLLTFAPVKSEFCDLNIIDNTRKSFQGSHCDAAACQLLHFCQRGPCLTQSILPTPHRPVVTYTQLCPGLSHQPQLYHTSNYLDVCLSSPFVKSPSTPLMTRRNSQQHPTLPTWYIVGSHLQAARPVERRRRNALWSNRPAPVA